MAPNSFADNVTTRVSRMFSLSMKMRVKSLGLSTEVKPTHQDWLFLDPEPKWPENNFRGIILGIKPVLEITSLTLSSSCLVSRHVKLKRDRSMLFSDFYWQFFDKRTLTNWRQFLMRLSCYSVIMNFVITLSKQLWIHEAICRLLWQCYDKIHCH